MRFAEQFVEPTDTRSEPRLGVTTADKMEVLDEFAGSSRFAVNLLPAHPFQYVPHESLQNLLVPGVIDSIREAYALEAMTFVVNKRLRRRYQPKLEGLSCDVRYSTPRYPFSLRHAGLDGARVRLIGWFEFIVIAQACLGIQVAEFPVSATFFGGNSAT